MAYWMQILATIAIVTGLLFVLYRATRGALGMFSGQGGCHGHGPEGCSACSSSSEDALNHREHPCGDFSSVDTSERPQDLAWEQRRGE